MKEIYSFSVDVERDVEESIKKRKKNRDTGKMEDISVEQMVRKEVPIKIILKEPNRREIEEADMEYSIQMSKCIKRGILTKAMLAKKYSDSGGLLSEEDAKYLTKKYGELGDLQTKYTRLSTKSKKTKADEAREKKLLGEMGIVRREIVDMETTYSSLFNHTADSKAQNRVILWYLVNLAFYQEDEEDDAISFFKAEEVEDKIDEYYDLDENGHEIFDVVKEKLSTFLSFWYFSANATKQDFDDLNKDIDEGEFGTDEVEDGAEDGDGDGAEDGDEGASEAPAATPAKAKKK